MERADTKLLTRMDDGEISTLGCVPAQVFVIAMNRQTRRVEEYRPGMAIPASAALGCDMYRVPAQARTAVFAAHGAFSCTTQNGNAFQPGFCFSCGLRFISPLGLGETLRRRITALGCAPDAVTLDDLYSIMEPAFTAACRRAAEAFSGGETLPYAQWYQELTNGAAFADRLERKLLPVFNACGFRLELDSLRITGLAPVPAA